MKMSPPAFVRCGMNDEGFAPWMIRRRFVRSPGEFAAREGFRGVGLGGGRWAGRCELAHRRRPRVEGFEARQRRRLVADQKLAIELLADLDTAVGVGTATGGRGDGQAMAVEGDGVVLGDDALVFETEDAVRLEAGRPGAVAGFWLGGSNRKTGVEAGEEGMQGRVGGFGGG